MIDTSNVFMVLAAVAGAVIASVLAIVLFIVGQPLPGAGLTVLAIASLGTLPFTGHQEDARR